MTDLEDYMRSIPLGECLGCGVKVSELFCCMPCRNEYFKQPEQRRLRRTNGPPVMHDNRICKC